MIKTLGRLLLSAMFIIGGFGAFSQPGYRPQKVAAAGIPRPRESVILNGAVMMVGGTALAAGIMPRLAAAALAITLIPTTLVGHSYWQEDEPATKAQQRIHFLKNLAMLGGLLLVVADDKE